ARHHTVMGVYRGTTMPRDKNRESQNNYFTRGYTPSNLTFSHDALPSKVQLWAAAKAHIIKPKEACSFVPFFLTHEE
ncbi:hypothetical protein ACQP3J_31880, partial [Escherichia coli]